jgi:hypothetical protein
MRSFVVCPSKYYLDDQMKKNEVGGAYGIYEEQVRSIQGFSGDT